MLINVLNALASVISKCSLHVILLSKIITDIFYMIDKVDIPFFQCKMSLGWSNSNPKSDSHVATDGL
jgi:hypothetical protein